MRSIEIVIVPPTINFCRMDKTKQHTVFVAYHKAGHAVASCQLGFGARKVTIVPTDTAEGSMSPKGYVQLHRLEWDTFTGARLGRFHDKIVVLLAGVEAQRRYSPRSVRSLHLHRKDSDFHAPMNCSSACMATTTSAVLRSDTSRSEHKTSSTTR